MRKRSFTGPVCKKLCATTMSFVMAAAFAPGVSIALADEDEDDDTAYEWSDEDEDEGEEEDNQLDYLELDEDSFPFTGKVIRPAITVYDYAGDEVDASAYTLSYEIESPDPADPYETTWSSISADKLSAAGTYRVLATAKEGSDYTGTVEDYAEFSIEGVSLDYDCYLGLDQRTFLYKAGETVDPGATLYDDNDHKVATENYTLSYFYRANEDSDWSSVKVGGFSQVGEYCVRATGVGEKGYSGSCTADFFITTASDLEHGNIELSASRYTYTGKAIAPEITVADASGNVVDPSSYTLEYQKEDGEDEWGDTEWTETLASELVNVGDYRVRAVAKSGSGYTGSTNYEEFRIFTPTDLSEAWISAPDVFYSGKAVAPKVTLYDYNDQVIDPQNYTLSYARYNEEEEEYVEVAASQIVALGEYRVTATGNSAKGYSGTCTSWFEMKDASDLEYASIELGSYHYLSKGSAVAPAVTVTDGAGNVVDPGSYTLEYQKEDDEGQWTATLASELVEPGSYRVRATAKDDGGYSGNTSYEQFRIYSATDLEYATLRVTNELDYEGFQYTGSAVTPEVTVTDLSGQTVSPSAYTLSYARYDEQSDEYVDCSAAELVQAGHYRVQATAKDGSGYTGYASSSFTISNIRDLSNGYTYFSEGSDLLVKTGAAIEPEISVRGCFGTYIDPSNYTIGYEKASGDPDTSDQVSYTAIKASELVDVGYYRLTVTAKSGSGYTGSLRRTFRIAEANDLSAATGDLNYLQAYTGKALDPGLILTDPNGKTIDSSKYALSYKRTSGSEAAIAMDTVSEVGSYQVTATAKAGSGYTGSYTGYFEVAEPSDLDASTMSFSSPTTTYYGFAAYVYTGSPIAVSATVTSVAGQMIDSSNYQLSFLKYDDNGWYSTDVDTGSIIQPGGYSAIATARDESGYTGRIQTDFYVLDPKDLGNAQFSLGADSTSASLQFNGQTIEATNYNASLMRYDESKGYYIDANMSELGTSYEGTRSWLFIATPAAGSGYTGQLSEFFTTTKKGSGKSSTGSSSKPAKKVTSATINAKTVSAASVAKALGANAATVKTVTLGSKVKTIKASAFKGTAVKTLVLKTTKLTKKNVKGALKGSKVTSIQVKVGGKSANKKQLKKYKKIFTKKICGKKVALK